MLRVRTFNEKPKGGGGEGGDGPLVYDNYIRATYTGQNVTLLGSAFDINQVDMIVYNGKSIGKVKSYNFPSGGDNVVDIVMIPITTTVANMFNTCTALKSIDTNKFDMSNVKSMENFLFKCEALINLEYKNQNLNNVTTMRGMCSECKNLKTMTFTNVSTRYLNNMEDTFNWTNLTNCDLSGLDLSKVTTMKGMFRNCWNLVTLKIMSPVTSLQDRTQMFFLVFTSGTFYHNKKYDYSKLKVPNRWKKVPI